MSSIRKEIYFIGEVKFIGQGFINAKYSVVCNGAIIKVKNSFHIRLIKKQFSIFPESFKIIAPMKAIKIISGVIPRQYIHYLPESEYLSLQKKYQSFNNKDEIEVLIEKAESHDIDESEEGIAALAEIVG